MNMSRISFSSQNQGMTEIFRNKKKFEWQHFFLLSLYGPSKKNLNEECCIDENETTWRSMLYLLNINK